MRARALSGTLARGRDVETDEQLLYQLNWMAADNPGEFAAINLNEYRDHISKSDIRALAGMQANLHASAQKPAADVSLQQAFTQAGTQLEGAGVSLTGLQGSARAEQAERRARFQNILVRTYTEFQNANGRAPNAAEVQDMINDLLLPVTITKSRRFLWDKTVSGRAFDLDNMADSDVPALAIDYTDIPIGLRRAFVTDLRAELGREPTQDEVITRYMAFRSGR